jgi:drug/metabolite transporter (DMT)-like permease
VSDVSWGLAGAFAAAVAYGVATVLQALGARQQGSVDDLDVHLIGRLLRSTPYVLGVALDGVGFGLSFIALRSEPLFLVQAVVASSLAVTAIMGVTLLGARPARAEWLALGAVTAGLSLLGLSANSEHPAQLPRTERLLLLSLVVAVGIAAYFAARSRRSLRQGDAWAFGVLAGLMYGAGGISARVLTPSHRPLKLLADPALWALISAGLLGLLLYAMALQRGSVTVATAAATTADTLVPAAVGVFLLGDRPAPGRTAFAAAGFALTVAGAVALARFGEAPVSQDEPAAPPVAPPEIAGEAGTDTVEPAL